MKSKKELLKCGDKKTTIKNRCSSCSSSGAIYGLGIFGALFYFLQGANTFTLIVVGIFKSIFWPAFVLFKILTNLQI
jgi:hypothetical protein